MRRTHLLSVFLTAAAVLAALYLTPGVARGGLNGCDIATPPNCNGAQGDAACESGEVCAQTGVENCGCVPPVCCRCENTDATGGGGCPDLGCTDSLFGTILLCVAPCLIFDFGGLAECNLTVVGNERCADGECPADGCCNFNAESVATGASEACANTDEGTCDFLEGVFVAGGMCDSIFGGCTTPTATPTATSTATATNTSTPTATNTPTQTPTQTPTSTFSPTRSPSPTVTSTQTATTTPTPQPNGSDCVTPGQCESDFCVDGVCCDTECTAPLERCDVPGSVGTCTVGTAAPAASHSALLIGVVLLMGVGAAALMRQRGIW